MQISLGEEHGINNIQGEEEKKEHSSADLVMGGATKIKCMYDFADKTESNEVCQPGEESHRLTFFVQILMSVVKRQKFWPNKMCSMENFVEVCLVKFSLSSFSVFSCVSNSMN